MDRDGWGSATLLVATLGPDVCDLDPTKSKHVVPLVNDADHNHHIWVLDIPAPTSWESLAKPTAGITWVDHHLASWSTPPPSWVRTVLPVDDRPTTTMSLLVRHGLAVVEGGHEFVRRLCTLEDAPWGLVFDGLSEMFPDLPVPLEALPELLAAAPRGDDVPAALIPAMDRARRQRKIVDEILAEADLAVEPGLVVARLDDARRVPLSRYSLALGRRHPGRLAVIVHRQQRLYCGRSSQQPGLDLIQHFRNRGFDPKGHPYVCNVDMRKDLIEDELAALRAAMDIAT